MQYRPDIDGLRAVAVTVVVAFHAFPSYMPGGFVGVDIFFVISGYLISGMILSDVERQRFTYWNFYARRVRRIFPALIVVLLTTLALGWTILLPNEYESLARHVLAGALFMSNFQLWAEDGYFDIASNLKPLLHLWSLAIEEQFYLLWPALLVLLWQLRRGRMMWLLTITVASFALNVALVAAYPVATFYLPVTRLWEFSIGALLAANMYWRTDRTPTNNALSIAGVTLIALSLIIATKAALFPGWIALLPTTGAALIIAAGPNAVVNRRFLSLRVAVFLGLISYPLYLWHWPLISFANISAQSDVTLLRVLKVAAVLAALVLAYLTYRMVELPIRAMPLNRISLRLLPVMGIVALCAIPIVQTSGFATWRELATLKPFASIVTTPNCIERFGKNFGQTFTRTTDFCLHAVAADGPADFVLVGDSHAYVLSFGMNSGKQSFAAIGRGSCLPFVGYEAASSDGLEPRCQEFLRPLYRDLISSPPRVLLLHGFFSRPPEHPIRKSSPAPLHDEIADTFRLLSPHVERLVVVLGVPRLPFEAKECLRRPYQRGQPRPCLIPRGDYERQRQDHEQMLRSAAAGFDNIAFFDPAEALCDADYCYGARYGKLLYVDSHHLNDDGAALVGAILLSSL